MRTTLAFTISFVLCTALLPVESGSVTASDPAVTKPNIALLFIDDWAWNGSPVPMDGRDEKLAYRHKELQLTEGFTQPHHAAKWWVWQGGIRVPMIINGPGIKAGSVFDGNVVNYDFLPTFVDWAGGNPTALKNIDGVSLAAYMAGEPPTDTFLKRKLYFHYPHYRSGMPHSAVVSGTRKLLHFYERPDLPMLFDLDRDVGEFHNIAPAHQEEHRRLYDSMTQYFDEVGARIPKLNPNYDAAVYRSSKEYEKRVQWGPFAGSRPPAEDEK